MCLDSKQNDKYVASFGSLRFANTVISVFIGRIRRIPKSDCYFRYVCPSEKIRLLTEEFDQVLFLIFSQICPEN
jgi:hypothetical protein